VVATGTLAYSASDRTIFGGIDLSNRQGSLSLSIHSDQHAPTTRDGRLRVTYTASDGTGAYATVIYNHGSGIVTISTANSRFTATLITLH
jgi:hypothetical protein